jgi:hypothetical protein
MEAIVDLLRRVTRPTVQLTSPYPAITTPAATSPAIQ